MLSLMPTVNADVVSERPTLSMLVSAIHAIRPLVRRGEVLIAGGFGLLHGLSFAARLGSLDLSRSSLVTTRLGFNVGIELTQLFVLALVMPSLLLLSRTSAYPVLRLSAATPGAVLASGWLAERGGLISTNPAEPVASVLVDHPVALALALAVVAVMLAGTGRSWTPQSVRSWRPSPLDRRSDDPGRRRALMDQRRDRV